MEAKKMKTKFFIFLILAIFIFVFISCGSRYGDKRDAGVKIQMDSALRKSLALNRAISSNPAVEDYYLTVVIYEFDLLRDNEESDEINKASAIQAGSVLYEQFTTTDKIIKYQTQPIYWDDYLQTIDFLDVNADKNYIVEAAITLGQPEQYMTNRYQVTDPIAYGIGFNNELSESSSEGVIILTEAALQYQKTRSIEGNVPYLTGYEINEMYGSDDIINDYEIDTSVLSEFTFDTKSVVALSHDGLRISKQITSSDTTFKFDLPVNKYYSLSILLENDEYEFNVPLMSIFDNEQFDYSKLSQYWEETSLLAIFYLSDGADINLGSFKFEQINDSIPEVYAFENSVFQYIDRDGDGISDSNDTNPYSLNQFSLSEISEYPLNIRYTTATNLLNEISRMWAALMVPSPSDNDVDGDGIQNYIDIDIDGNGVPNFKDNDIFGKGVSDTVGTVVDLAKKFFYNGEISEAARLFSRAYNVVGGYKDAMDMSPSYSSSVTSTEKAEIGFYLALSRIYFFLESGQSSIALSDNAALFNTKRLLDGLGFSADNRKLINFDPDDPRVVSGYDEYFKFKTDTIDQENLQKEYIMYLTKELIMALEYLEYASNYNVNIEISYQDIYNLREAAEDFSDTFGVYDKVIVDEGDLLLLKSFINFDLFSIFYTLLSGDLDIVDNENLLDVINEINASDTYDMESFLNTNQNFLKHRDDFEDFGFEDMLSEFDADFSTLFFHHQFASMFLQEALSEYKEASDYIRNTRSISGANSLISFMDESDTSGLDDVYNEVQFRNVVDSAYNSLYYNEPIEISEDGENITVDFNRFFDLPNGLRDFIPAMNKDEVVEQGAYDYSKFGGQGKLIPDWTPERLRLAAGFIEEKDIMSNVIDFRMDHHQPKDLYYSVVVTDTQILYGELEDGEWSFYEIENGEYTSEFEMLKVFQFQNFKLFLRDAGEMHYQLSVSLAGASWSDPFQFDFKPNELVVTDINVNEDNSLTLLIDTEEEFYANYDTPGLYVIDIPYDYNINVVNPQANLENIEPQLFANKLDESLLHENFSHDADEHILRVRKNSQNQVYCIIETTEYLEDTNAHNKYNIFLVTSDGPGSVDMTEIFEIESADMYRNLLTRFNSNNELVIYYAVINGDLASGFDEAEIKIYEKIGDNAPTELFSGYNLLADFYYDGQDYFGIAIGKTDSDTGIFYIYKEGNTWNIELMKRFTDEWELYHITKGNFYELKPFSIFNSQKIFKTPDNNTVYTIYGERLYYKYQTSNWAKQYLPFWADYVPNRVFVDNNLLIHGSVLIWDHYNGNLFKNLYLAY
jgi:hypothetical protein